MHYIGCIADIIQETEMLLVGTSFLKCISTFYICTFKDRTKLKSSNVFVGICHGGFLSSRRKTCYFSVCWLQKQKKSVVCTETWRQSLSHDELTNAVYDESGETQHWKIQLLMAICNIQKVKLVLLSFICNYEEAMFVSEKK